jgi:vitamin B12 transporter
MHPPRHAACSFAVLCATAFLPPSTAPGQTRDPAYELPKLTIYSQQVANQTPASTFAMPVSGVQFEPGVDVQARNLAEAQADIAIRGGTFENTSVRIGSASFFDPQTGHYVAEIPVPPAMLGTPSIITGSDHARGGFNAQVGSIAYGWRPIESRGELAVAAGGDGFNRQGLYEARVWPAGTAGRQVAADVELARSESDGSVPFGDHDFKRAAARLQVRGEGTQTDFFAGWQEKFFGWPNLYTPFGFNETEHLKTELWAVNHRAEGAGGDYWQASAYYRRNYDDYEFNRAVPGASNPFVHTTRVRGAAAEGRRTIGAGAIAWHAQYLGDSLESTALTFGRFRDREYLKLALVPEYEIAARGGQLTLKVGAAYDDTNRDGDAMSPILEASWAGPTGLRLYAQYAESTQVASYTALNSNPAAGLFRGNANLGRETSRNWEAGAGFTRGPWRLQAALFHRRDDELVDWTFRRGVTARAANAVDIDTTGLELVAVLNSRRLDLVLGYAWLEKDADYGGAAVDASFYALNFPRHRLTAAVVARLAAGLELRVDNEWRLQEENLLRTAGGDEALLTSAGLYWLPRAAEGLEVSLRMDNVWDDDFQEVPAVPAARRQWSAGLTWHW